METEWKDLAPNIKLLENLLCASWFHPWYSSVSFHSGISSDLLSWVHASISLRSLTRTQDSTPASSRLVPLCQRQRPPGRQLLVTSFRQLTNSLTVRASCHYPFMLWLKLMPWLTMARGNFIWAKRKFRGESYKPNKMSVHSPHLAYGLFRSVLFTSQILGDFPDFFLWLILI